MNITLETTRVAHTLFAKYLKARKPQYVQFLTGSNKLIQESAQSVLREIRIREQWRMANGETVGEFERYDANCRNLGDVRLRIVADDCNSYDDLEGDTFNPKVNDDIPESRLEREQKEFRARVDRDGVWGVIGEYWAGNEWEHVDSCFGFVGEDWKESGYDLDIMRATLDASREYLASVNG